MDNFKIKLAIGFITYGKATAKYLPYFLPSLMEQTYDNFKIFAVDNTEDEDNKNAEYISEKYPEINLSRAGGNLGFARAYNLMIKQAADMRAEYFMMLNPDMRLDPGAVKRLIEAMESDGELGSASPKILKWDFINNKKTDIIDTCGIILKPGLRFVDAGQGRIDKGRFDNLKILGPSGAAGIFRLSALEKVKHEDKYFDELMFMYKEDCDLAYRLWLAGYKSKCVGKAFIYHDRTAYGRGEGDLSVAINRKNKSRKVKEWSFLNQHIIFLKHWSKQNFLNKLAITRQAFKMLIFVLIFERYLLKQYLILWKIRNKINDSTYAPGNIN